MPFNWRTTEFGLTPDRNAKDIRRLIASDYAAAFPPAFPMVVNTSHKPS